MTLEEDFAELLDATLEEDFALLLDFALELDCGVTLEEDFALLLVMAASEPPSPCSLLELLLDLSLLLRMTLLDEDDDVISSQSSQTLDEDSSSRGAKLLSSSPHAARINAKTSAKMQVKEKCFIIPQIVCRKYRKRSFPICKKYRVNKLFRLILGT